jgi:tubulin--tyrosine ligase-like protein 12
MNHMNTPEFLKEFEKEHQGFTSRIVSTFKITYFITDLFAIKILVKWLEIHESIRSMIRCVFESASVVHPEMQNPFSRAIYGVDVMLDTSFKPKILEVCLLY